MKQLPVKLLLAFFPVFVLAQPTQNPPKLVVGIVVDQMRPEYINRFWPWYAENGLRRLVLEGYNCANTHYNYVPTYTGPGHACIATGASPSVNGIVGNEWFDRDTERTMYCAQDDSVRTIGSPTKDGQMSPRNLLSNTVGDELRMATSDRAKVIGIALKDRGAILSTGHRANAAYWFDGKTGTFISSSFYMEQLPAWVSAFNQRERAEELLKRPWELLFPTAEYAKICTADDVPYEGKYRGEDKPVFPHNFPGIRDKNTVDLIRSTPWGNTLTFEMAEAAIEGEALGQDEVTDLLMVSFSSTDYIGHQFGPRSMEIADMYMRFDRELAAFIDQVETKVGAENVVFFLSADHAVAENPQYLLDRRTPAGFFPGAVIDSLRQFSKRTFKADLIKSYRNQQIYLDYNAIYARRLEFQEVYKQFNLFLNRIPGLAYIINRQELAQLGSASPMFGRVINGYYPKRSGDILLIFEPGWFESGWTTGTTHGSGYSYDTHVPMLWYGRGHIPQGRTFRPTRVVDIAPTVAALLGIPFPNGNTGEPILEVLK